MNSALVHLVLGLHGGLNGSGGGHFVLGGAAAVHAALDGQDGHRTGSDNAEEKEADGVIHLRCYFPENEKWQGKKHW